MGASRAVLVVNAGSSSLKYQVLDADTGETSASGIVERIGGPGRLRHSTGGETHEQDVTCRDHTEALDAARAALREHGPDLGGLGLLAVGHRVVHGGPDFTEPVVIDDDVVSAIQALVPLAPLHNPASALGLRAIQKKWPHMPQVCVFDTAFHRSMPEHVWRYALPEEMYSEYGVRRYGFHGTSHDYVTGEAARFLGVERDSFDAVVAHLGNGASATAIRDGASYDTSMGYTPLAGLIMGTRTGDLDPSIVTALLERYRFRLTLLKARVELALVLRWGDGDDDVFGDRRVALFGGVADGDQNVGFGKVRRGAAARNLVGDRDKALGGAGLAVEMARQVEHVALVDALFGHVVGV